MTEPFSTPLLLIGILGTAGAALPLLGIARRDRGSHLYAAIALGALAASLALVGYQVISGVAGPPAALPDGVLADDAFGAVLAAAMIIVALISTAGSIEYMRKRSAPAVYYSLILLATVGMVLVVYSADLVMLFVAWELMSIPTYVLVGFNKRNPGSNEAALKYFLFGALASAVIVYAISLAYGLTGSTNIGEVVAGFAALDISMVPLALLSVGLFIAGFGFKMGLVPFHQWLPDAYEGAPAPVAALLAAATKKAGFAAAIRVVVMGMISLSVDWTLALGVLAVMTMTVGNVAAIMQRSVSRMLAYSSIGHAGYILVGLAVAPHSQLGMQGAVYHIFNHAVMKGAAFVAVAGMVVALAATHMDKLAGLGRKMPVTSLGFVLSLFALAGIPPLSGFWSKLVLFEGAIDAGSSLWWAPWLAIAGVLNSALSLAYYGWITRRMYFEGEREKRIAEPRSIAAVMIAASVFLVAFGIYPEPLLGLASSAAPLIP
ncbi:MAG: NADH-quinone oxidoreductase subunit N [Nitrosopumilus sp.]|nr:NADH-quinone oxidoreductase subunit N [Nitrosopumilus sp.]MDA7959765.1 NADH-quinone oxidoreductase subunit N [Nitrosopumilus sp.]